MKTNRFLIFLVLLALPFTATALTKATQSFTTSGAGTFIPPTTVYSVLIEAWGGGGGGGSSSANPGAGNGGNGGDYGTSTIAVIPGNSYSLNVGAKGTGGTTGGGDGTVGSSSTWQSTVMIVPGGQPGIHDVGATTTQSTAGCVATKCIPGGNGAKGIAGTRSGGGGGGAGSNGPGGNASSTAITAGTGTSNNPGGNGGDGTASAATGGLGNQAGGGGGGGNSTGPADKAGADGGDGQINVTYTLARRISRGIIR